MMDAGDLSAIVASLERILTDATLGNGELPTFDDERANVLWSALDKNGYPLLCVAEEQGGIGASLADIGLVALLAGRFALPLPIADTLLANALMAQSSIEPPRGKTGLVDPSDPNKMLAYAEQLQGVLRFTAGNLSYHALDRSKLTLAEMHEDGAAILKAGLDDPVFEAAAPNWLTARSFRALAAMVRAAQMAGAMQAVLELTLTYTREREQFGRPLAKFQAIQHHLADIACETAASVAAVELASDALRADPQLTASTLHEVVVAKIRCGEAAGRVAAASHQAHGAMGFTHEYALGRYTRRLWQWQDEFGSGDEWAIGLGHIVLAEDQPELWPYVSRAI